MKGEIAATALALLLLALIFGAEAELCHFRSRTYIGRCFSSENCAAVCVTEHYTGGFCKGIVTRQCMCTKECGDGDGGDGPPGGGEDKAPPLPVNPPLPVYPPPVSGGGNAPPLPVNPPLPITPPLPVYPPPVGGGGNAPPLPVNPPLPITPPLPVYPPPGCKPPTLKDEEKEPSVELTAARARRVGGHA